MAAEAAAEAAASRRRKRISLSLSALRLALCVGALGFVVWLVGLPCRCRLPSLRQRDALRDAAAPKRLWQWAERDDEPCEVVTLVWSWWLSLCVADFRGFRLVVLPLPHLFPRQGAVPATIPNSGLPQQTCFEVGQRGRCTPSASLGRLTA